MATGPRYFVPFRRRREGKTDYYSRARLIVADVPRMVVRRTNRQVICQLVTAELNGDRTLVTATSLELPKLGYTGATANTPAAYLTGMLFAKKALAAGHERAILDIGLARANRGSRVFAALKGAVEGGLEVPHGEEILPDDDRVRGAHIAAFAPDRAGGLVENVEQVTARIQELA
ncbi:MAG TPA: 50S ribosomal protein L18 [Methanoregulaceae archaeon]|nr:50S ribosomal protein L18 [Methanoregulaceae archaeon]HOV66803.1 50S ribosomal protein L18 [Methanoregulaceae archaeon]HQJ88459.1 50S ribosomal protein L18 [Methanoregulaceae archaeon]